MSGSAAVLGVGMVPFAKPGASLPYTEMAVTAVRSALDDADLSYQDVQQAFAGYVYGDSTCGQRVLYEAGMTGIPISNVNNNCSTGSTALYLARQAVLSGEVDVALAVGFEQMQPGALQNVYNDRPLPLDHFDAVTAELVGDVAVPFALKYFGGAGLEHMKRYGTPIEAFASIRAKASRHAANNPLALFRKEMSVEDVLSSPIVWPGVMTRPMACPPTCGAAAAIVVSERFAKQQSGHASIRIRAQAMVTDRSVTFEGQDMRMLAGYDMTRRAAATVYEAAGIGPEDVDVIELHDCFAHNELITYEGLGLCPEGEAGKFVFNGDNTYGGKYVTNPSGGLLSKGHPLGATGLAQCFELVQQLRGNAGARQAPDTRLALQHNLGLGGACVVTLYERTTN